MSRIEGATASFVFTGTFIRVLGARAADGGRADVQICAEHGESCSDAVGLDAASKSEAAQQVLYANYQLDPGRHMIKLTVRSAVDGMRAFYLDAFAYGTPIAGDHYIDNQVGSACSNDHFGAAPETPWCDFTPVNGATFAPGSRILLARGATWNQLLGKLYGEGSADRFIEVDAYGAGPRPKIARDRAVMDRAIWLDNPSYWRLANLEIADAAAGIVAYYTTNDHVGLRFEDIYTHDNDVVLWRASGDWSPAPDLPGMYHGAAIFITGNVPVTASSYAQPTQISVTTWPNGAGLPRTASSAGSIRYRLLARAAISPERGRRHTMEPPVRSTRLISFLEVVSGFGVAFGRAQHRFVPGVQGIACTDATHTPSCRATG